MNNRLFSEVRNAVVIVVLLFYPSIPAPSAADDRLASGKSFQLLNDEILQVAESGGVGVYSGDGSRAC